MSWSSASIAARKSCVSSLSSFSSSSRSGGAYSQVLSMRLRAAAIFRDGNYGGSSSLFSDWWFDLGWTGGSYLGAAGGGRASVYYLAGSINSGGYFVSGNRPISEGSFSGGGLSLFYLLCEFLFVGSTCMGFTSWWNERFSESSWTFAFIS